MQFHIVCIAHLDHQLGMVVLRKEVVVGLGQFYFYFELHWIDEINPIEKGLFFSNCTVFMFYLWSFIGFVLWLNFSYVVQHIVVVPCVFIPLGLMIRNLSDNFLPVLWQLFLSTTAGWILDQRRLESLLDFLKLMVQFIIQPGIAIASESLVVVFTCFW